MSDPEQAAEFTHFKVTTSTVENTLRLGINKIDLFTNIGTKKGPSAWVMNSNVVPYNRRKEMKTFVLNNATVI